MCFTTKTIVVNIKNCSKLFCSLLNQNKLFIRQNGLIAYHFVIHQKPPSYRRIPIAFKIRNTPPGGKISVFVRSYPYEPEEYKYQNLIFPLYTEFVIVYQI